MGKWKRVKIEQFLKEPGGRYDPGNETVQGLKWLNKIDFSGEIHLSDKGSKTNMLITVKGSGVGKLNINDKDGLVISRQLMAIQNLLNNNDYCFCWLRTLFVSLQELKDGLIPGIGRDDILLKKFPLPPIAEQQAIAERVDKLMAMIDELEKQVSECRDQAEMLMQSVL